MDQLPPQHYQVAAIIHPGVWNWHGSRQVQAWYADCIRRGLILVPPEDGWRAVLAASDCVIGDIGSVTCYAAAAGIPVLLGPSAVDEIETGSPIAILGDIAPRLRPEQPYGPQLERAASAWQPHQYSTIRALVTDAPGRSAAIIRSAMYKLMKLPEPAGEPQTRPVPIPRPVTPAETFGGVW